MIFNDLLALVFICLFSKHREIPGWVSEKALKVLVRKQQEISLEIIVSTMLYGFCLGLSWVLTYPGLLECIDHTGPSTMVRLGPLINCGRCEVGDGSSTVGSCEDMYLIAESHSLESL